MSSGSGPIPVADVAAGVGTRRRVPGAAQSGLEFLKTAVPGDRFIVDLDAHDPGYSHEMILLAIAFPDAAVVYTPGGHRYIESGRYWHRVWKCTGCSTYPTDAPDELIQFENVIERPALLKMISAGLKEAIAEQKARPALEAVVNPTSGVDWEGEKLPLTVAGAAGSKPDVAPRPADLRDKTGVGGGPSEGTPRGDTLEAGEDHVWLVASSAPLPLGHEISDLPKREKATTVGDLGLFRHTSGATVLVERVKIADVPNYVFKKRSDFYVQSGRKIGGADDTLPGGGGGGAAPPPAGGGIGGLDGATLADGDLRGILKGTGADGAAPPAPGTGPVVGGTAGAPGDDDPRTLWVDTDSYGFRRKGWEALVNESYHVPFGEHTQIRGPSTVVSTLRYMFENGGDPRKWLDQFQRSKRLEEGDRVLHELRPIVDAFYYGGVVDQVNMPALASFESLSRRLLGIIDAYAGDGSKPNWRVAGHISGGLGIDDAMSLEMRTFIQRTVRERNELDTARRRASDGVVDTPGDTGGGGGSSAAAPGGGKVGKGEGKGARARKPPSAAAKK